jgi:putative DNA primase/helicase
MNDLKKFYDQYDSQQFCIIPIKYKSKQPAIKEWQKRTANDNSFERDFPEELNIGIVLGKNSNGLADIDLDCPEAVKAAPYLLPDTDMVFGRKSKPKSHYIYRVNGCSNTLRLNDPTDGAVILEYRGNGGQTVFPPSTHPTGEIIGFDRHGTPATVTDKQLLAAFKKVAAASLMAKHWKMGRRHEAALALAGGLHRSGWSENEICTLIEAVCKAADDEEADDRLNAVRDTVKRLANDEVATGWPTLINIFGETIIDRVMEWLDIHRNIDPTPPHTSIDLMAYDFNDMGNADRFIAMYGKDVLYLEDQKLFAIWQDKKWELDSPTLIDGLAQSVAIKTLEAANSVQSTETRDIYIKRAKRLGNTASRKYMIETVKPRLATKTATFDTEELLINCQNGTVNIKDGTLQKHDRQNYITALIPYNYNTKADCPVFKKFLSDICGNNGELIRFLQIALGYSLTGSTKEQCFFIAHGSGANGKSTLLELVRELIGDYGATSPISTFIADNKQSSIPNDIARLRGKRFVLTSEGNIDQPLDSARIKRISGSDTETARLLHKEYVEFKPHCKLWFMTNHLPKINGNDPALARRIRVIPFNVTFKPEDMDNELPFKLRSEKEGILAWLIDGAIEWNKNGLQTPETVIHATKQYITDMDHIQQFLDDRIDAEEGSSITKSEMYCIYKSWCENSGIKPLTKPSLGSELIKKGLQEKRTSGDRFWNGVKEKSNFIN